MSDEMLGVLRTPRNTGPSFAPSTLAALCPVAGAPVIERAASALARAGGDEVLVVSDDRHVSDWAARSDALVADETSDADAVRERAADHDRVVVVDAAALVPSTTLGQLGPAPAPTGTETPAAADGGTGTAPAAFAAPPAAFDEVSSDGALDQVAKTAPEDARVAWSAALDARRPWELLAANEAYLAHVERTLAGDVHPDAECRGAVVVEPTASVDAGVVLEGPAYVGRGATVGPNAYVRGRTFLGRNAHVGHSVEIKNSVVMAGAQVPHLSYVGDSVVGPDANLGAGTIVANLRHDGDAVEVAHDGDRVSTGRRKFGAVVGSDAKLGIGTRLNVGVTVGPGATTNPGEVVTRDRAPRGE